MDYGFRKIGNTEYKNVKQYQHPTYGICYTATSNAGKCKFSVTKPTALEAAKALDLYCIKRGMKQVNNTYKAKP